MGVQAGNDIRKYMSGNGFPSMSFCDLPVADVGEYDVS